MYGKDERRGGMLKPSGGDSKWKERVGLDKQLKSFVDMSWTVHLKSSIHLFTLYCVLEYYAATLPH
jgi:hypothetical protein